MQVGKWSLSFGLGAALTAGVFLVAPQFRSRTLVVPPWHPFDLRCDLTLDDLVADGYRVSDMPCGMVHFSKSVGDTTIRYFINIQCETYEGKYESQELIFLESDESEVIPSFDQVPDTSRVENSTYEANYWGEEAALNPYWPFDADSVRKCYQHHYWRHYWFTMAAIDSMAIRSFVKQHGGDIICEQWNCSKGGQLVVHYAPNQLTFICTIGQEQDQEGRLLPWEFEMITSIPFIDHTRSEEHSKRERKRSAYYGWDQ
ncbi:MAG: hypothetical protein IPM12_13525 [Flavobacteriales bacterium]|nr:hypothetical protein [Flavobacteriales bacterium]